MNTRPSHKLLTESHYRAQMRRLRVIAAALMSMVLVHPAIGDIPGATLTQVTNLNPPSYPRSLAAASDGKIWFSEFRTSSVGYFTPDGKVTKFPVPCDQCGPLGEVSVIESIAIGPDGNVWFPYSGFNGDLTPINGGMNSFIGRFTPAGAFAKYPIPTQQAFRQDFLSSASIGHSVITPGPDGNLWFTENWKGKVGKITTAGVVTEFPLSSTAAPSGITPGPDGNLWFAETGAGKIGRISPGGTLAEFPVPGGIRNPAPFAITAGPDSKLWFTDQSNGVDSITTTGTATRYNIEPDSSSSATQPSGITAGPDGKLYFPYFISGLTGNYQGKVARFDPATATSVTSDLPNMAFGNEIVLAPATSVTSDLPNKAFGNDITLAAGATRSYFVGASQPDSSGNFFDTPPFVLQVGAPPCDPPITINGQASPVEVSIILVNGQDLVNLGVVAAEGITQPIISEQLTGDVPSGVGLNDSLGENLFGLTYNVDALASHNTIPRVYLFALTIVDHRGCTATVNYKVTVRDTGRPPGRR